MKKLTLLILLTLILQFSDGFGQYASQDSLVQQTRKLFFEDLRYFKQNYPNDSMLVAYYKKMLGYALALDSTVKQSNLTAYLLKAVLTDSLTNRLSYYLRIAALTDSLNARFNVYTKLSALTDSLNNRLGGYLTNSAWEGSRDTSTVAYKNLPNKFNRAQYMDTLAAKIKQLFLYGGISWKGRYISEAEDSLYANDYYVQIGLAEANTNPVLYLKSVGDVKPYTEYKLKVLTLQGDSLSIYPTESESIENLSAGNPYVLKTDGISLTIYSDGGQWRIKDLLNPYTAFLKDTNWIRANTLKDSLSRYTKLIDSVKYVSPGYTINSGRYFSSIQTAITFSGSGTLINVLPGTYAEKIVLKDGVNLQFSKGAILTYGVNDTNALMTDNYTAVNCVISGSGTFTRGGTTGNPIYLTNAGSRVSVEGDLFSTSNACGVAYCIAGQLKIKARLVNSSVASKTYGAIRCSGGNNIAEVDSIYTDGDYSFYCAGGIQTIYLKTSLKSEMRCAVSIQTAYLIDVYNDIRCINSGSQTISCNNIYAGQVENSGKLQSLDFTNFYSSTNSSFISTTGGAQYITGKQFIYSSTNFGAVAPLSCSGQYQLQVVKLDILKGPTTLINVIANGTSYYDINQCILTNDTGHCLKIDSGSVHYTGGIMRNNTSLYACVEILGGDLMMQMSDTISNKGGYAALNVGTNAFAHITCPYIVDSSSSQAVIWYGRGILEADEIRNLQDDASAIDTKSSNLTIKNARIKSNTAGGVIAVKNFGSTWGGLTLDNCRVINVNPLGNSVKSYDVTDSVFVYGSLLSNYAKNSNITFLVGSETVSTLVK